LRLQQQERLQELQQQQERKRQQLQQPERQQEQLRFQQPFHHKQIETGPTGQRSEQSFSLYLFPKDNGIESSEGSLKPNLCSNLPTARGAAF
jgi:hypothetical protein